MSVLPMRKSYFCELRLMPMKAVKKKTFYLLAALLGCILAYLFWPLADDSFRIHWDGKQIEEKSEFLGTVSPALPSDSMPNIILIIADDLGKRDISFYGGEHINTPNIDNLAAFGVAFRRAYVASPVCSPSRAAILTGRYPQRFGFQHQMHDRYLKNRLEFLAFNYFVKSHPWHPISVDKAPSREAIMKQGLPPSEITIAEILKARGYATGLFGKWHLGWDDDNKPCQFGFDEQYGFYASNSLYAPVGTPGITSQKIEGDFTDKYMWKEGRNGPNGIFRNDEPVEEKVYLTDAITREAKTFIRKHAKDGPFFLVAAYNAPHTPLQAPDQWVRKFSHVEDPVRRVYYAMIAQLDSAVGSLVDEVDSLGLMKNTLVFFLSDNGGATYTLTTDNGPLRGGKITDFEGGLEVPFFMRWDGHVHAGLNYDRMVTSMDIFATIASASGSRVPAGRNFDGVDLMQFLGDTAAEPHDFLFWQRGHSKAISSDEWKLIWNDEYSDTLLYHIVDDPYELNDMHSQRQDIVDSLRIEHERWSRSLPPPLWPPVVRFAEKVDGRWFYFDD